ncbi:MAG: hypothetical protein RSB41_04430 [Bacilli bacterium]
MINLNNIKIDWTNFYVLTLESKQEVFFNNRDFGIGHTELTAEDYFSWAKEGIDQNKEISVKEIIEIISNVKRAIDCKCESFLKTYGFIEDINSVNYPWFKELIKGEPISFLSLISYLMDLNLIIIEEIRKLRNKTEHDYSIPTIEDAKRAVAVGELFLLAFNQKVNNIRYYCQISSEKYDDEFYICLYRDGDEDPFNSDSLIEINDTIFNSSKKEYAMLLKLLVNGDFNNLPFLFNKEIPSKSIRYKEYFDEDAMGN